MYTKLTETTVVLQLLNAENRALYTSSEPKQKALSQQAFGEFIELSSENFGEFIELWFDFGELIELSSENFGQFIEL